MSTHGALTDVLPPPCSTSDGSPPSSREPTRARRAVPRHGRRPHPPRDRPWIVCSTCSPAPTRSPQRPTNRRTAMKLVSAVVDGRQMFGAVVDDADSRPVRSARLDVDDRRIECAADARRGGCRRRALDPDRNGRTASTGARSAADPLRRLELRRARRRVADTTAEGRPSRDLHPLPIVARWTRSADRASRERASTSTTRASWRSSSVRRRTPCHPTRRWRRSLDTPASWTGRCATSSGTPRSSRPARTSMRPGRSGRGSSPPTRSMIRRHLTPP